GDERGSVDKYNNVYGTPRIPRNGNWHNFNSRLQKHPPVVLNAHQRTSSERAIRETCEKRDWHLYAINVRTNHIHTVVCSLHGKKPEIALIAFKANATR